MSEYSFIIAPNVQEILHVYITSSGHHFSVWLFNIHYKLICCYLCSAEQNNKASLKNNNERFIFMTESKTMSEWEKFFVTGSSRVSQVAAVIFSKDCQCWSVQGTGKSAGDRREVFLLCLPSTLCHWVWLPKRVEKIVLERKMESMLSAADWSVCGWITWQGHWFARENRSVTAKSISWQM